MTQIDIVKHARRAGLSVLAWSAMALPAAQAADDSLFDLSIEELVSLEVTSVSRKAERLSDTTSAVFVITQDDIQRYGIRSIPDALRLAPGLTVQQVSAGKWAIGSRGFTGRFSNKLLVLMDGRTLYTPTFSGVYWEVQDTLIEEIERIEVIRGPGAVAWGSNAVNGVINIITRRSDAADETELAGGIDPLGATFASARASGKHGESTSWRAFAKYQDTPANELVGAGGAGDDWDMLRVNVRTDTRWASSELTVIGEAYSGHIGNAYEQFGVANIQIVPDNATVDGMFALARWERSHGPDRSSSAQVSIDRNERDSLLYREDRTSFSLEAQHQRQFGIHELVFGGWARLNDLEIGGSQDVTLLGEIDQDHVISAFVQDNMQLTDRWSVMLGLKVEDNSLSPKDLEWMPSVRTLWKLSPNHSAWAAATRALRTPSWGERQVRISNVSVPVPPNTAFNPFPVPLTVEILGDPDFRSESNVALELGLRGRFGDKVSYDVALFNMDYDNIRSAGEGAPFCAPSGVALALDPTCLAQASAVTFPTLLANDATARARGGEVAIDWLAAAKWRLRGTLSFLDIESEGEAGDPITPDRDPRWQAGLRSEWSPSEQLNVALWLRYVGEIEEFDIDDYWQANINARWQYQDRVIVSLGVRNLLQSETFEYVSEFIDLAPTNIPRSAFLNLRLKF
ncbi:MAG: TonB-dependent receptor [Pseudomonadota bacterium]